MFSNIVSSETLGITLTAEIKPAAYQIGNSSPVLSNSNFFEVCSGEEFTFSIAAQDENADSIIYELCTPITGGGTYGTPENPGDPSACFGVMPNPACSPPFAPVTYNLPNYSFDHPLGVGSTLNLDRYTGEISGVPNIIGQFLVGVCIKEYINGELISESRQDLVFRVDFALDLQAAELEKLSFFPNPSNDKVYINLPKPSISFELNLRDANGRLVRRVVNLNGMNYELEVNDLKGIYFLELKSKEKIYLGKLVAF